MEIVYKTAKRPDHKTFDQVKDGQFCITNEGYLCQKMNAGCQLLIANSDGSLLGSYRMVSATSPIQGALPEISKIDFS